MAAFSGPLLFSMISKPNPLHSFWTGCKIATSVFGQFYGMIMIVGGLVYIAVPTLSTYMFATGAVSYLLGKSIDKSLVEEEKREHDEGSDDPPWPV